MSNLIQRGNAKLSFPYFNLPATQQVCGRQCSGCYAASEEHRWPTVGKAREIRYQAALQPDFASRIKTELTSMRSQPSLFRIHASGEFFSQPYVNAWHNIASAFPAITFYAYTKRLKDFDFSALQSLSNVCVIDSFRFGGLNYGKLHRKPASAFLCPDYKGNTGVQCGVTCTYCMTKTGAATNGVFFLQH